MFTKTKKPKNFHLKYIEMCKDGCSDVEISQFFGVTRKCLYEWFDKAKIVPDNESEEARMLREEVTEAHEIGKEARMKWYEETGRNAITKGKGEFNNEMYKWKAQAYLGNFADYRISLDFSDLDEDF